jgi:hypothetical protein
MIAIFLAAALLIDIPSTGVVELPAGETHLRWPVTIPKGSQHVTLRGNPKGSVLVLDAGFTGRAAIIAEGVSDLTLEGFAIQGNRTDQKSDWYLPLKEAAFADYYPDNGIVVRKSDQVVVRHVTFSRMRTFPLIVNASSNVTIDGVNIEDCGTLNRAGRNNTTGGILLEQGVAGF